MADDADIASDYEARHTAAALAAHAARAARSIARQTDHCADCGEAIPAQRLMAVPYATRCAPCAAIEERRHA